MQYLKRIKIDFENNFPGRIHHTFILYKNYGLVYGGIENKNVLGDFLMYDFNGKKWIILDGYTEKSEKGIFGHSANIYEDQMICFGGCNGKTLVKQLKKFDLNTHK